MFEWQEYLEVAKSLASNPKEGFQRSAVSRAYYAAFGVARDWLLRQNYILEHNGQDHFLVWNKFMTFDNRIYWKISTDGQRLRKNRGKADYDNILTDATTLANDSIKSAEWIIDKLSDV